MDKPRLLIIDDDANLRKTLTDILRVRGFEASASGSGNEGLACLHENPADVVLIDLGLPDIPGIEVLKRVRAEFPAMEAIIITGKATLDSAIEAVNIGAYSYLIKPYEVEQLILNIRRAGEKQRAENALRKSEEQFRKIFAESPLGMAIVDGGNRFVKVNGMLCRMLGYSEEELVALSYPDIVYMEDSKPDISNIRSLFKRRHTYWKNEKRCVRKSGERFWVNVTTSVIVDAVDGNRYLLKMLEDISKRKKAEQAIRNAKEEWERTFDAIIDPVMILDTDYQVVKANKAMMAKLGMIRSGFDGLRCYQIFHGTDSPPPFCPHAQFLADGQPHSTEVDIPRLGGHFLVVISPLYGADGKLQGSIHFARDISERKSLERQLRHAQKMEAIGTLAGGIAHDFNNILTAIIGYANLLEMGMVADDPLAPHVEGILSGAERAANLTGSLLAFSRKQEMKLGPVDINKVVTGVEKMLRRLIREDIEFNISLDAEELTVMADAPQLEQVLMNFAANSRDAITDNGMISIGTRLVELSREFSDLHAFGEPGRYALLTFTDNGAGMDEMTRMRIFDPFFTTKETGKGTGLGLAVCYGIIKQHNGFVTCYSEPGTGTTFKIYLPIINETAEVGRAVNEVQMPRGTETLLLAEDDVMTRRLGRLLLENSGYHVIEAANGEEAVANFSELKDEISLVLLDVIMPRMNGREAYRRIDLLKPGIKAIFISGYTADIFKKEELFEEGFNFLSKPILRKDLLVTVRNLLDS